MSTSTLATPEELKQRIRDLLHSYRLDEPVRRRQLTHLRTYARRLREARSYPTRPFHRKHR
jgi:hypothetical protein